MVDRRRKGVHKAGQLPPVVAGRHHRPRPRRRADRASRPSGTRPSTAPSPQIIVTLPRKPRPGTPVAGRRRPRAAAGRAADRRRGPPLRRAGSSRSSASRRRRCSASSAPCRTAAAGSCRSTRRRASASCSISPGDEGERAGRRPRRRHDRRSTAAIGLPHAKVRERLGSLKSEKAVSLIAIHAHGIPQRVPAGRAGRGGGRAARRRSRAARTGATCRSSPSIPPTPRTTTTPSTPRRTTIPTTGRLHRHGRHRRRRRLRAARLGARPRGAGARQLGLFPRPRRADAAGAHLQRPLLAARRARTAPGARRAHGDRRGRPQDAATRFHRVMMRSAAKLSYQQAQAAIDGRPDDDDRPAARHAC